MDYRGLIQHTVGKDQKVLEIGPSYNPTCPKSMGYNTTIFDHLPREDLVVKYSGYGVDVGRIEDVDVVGNSLSEIEGEFDVIVASHLIEHTPDFIAFLRDCSRLMHQNSRLYLLIPDKRYCFDALRPPTSTGNVIDSFLLGRKRHVGALFDTTSSAVARSGQNNWGANEAGPFKSIHNFREARAFLTAAMNTSDYMDCHAWCFTPASFRLIVFDLAAMAFVDLVESESHAVDGASEFYFVLKKGVIQDDEETSRRRAALAEKSWSEQAVFRDSVSRVPLKVRE